MTDVNDRATAVTSGGRPSADLAIIETRVYRGANVWSYDKAIHLVVDLGVLEEYPTNTLPGFTEHLLRGPARPPRALLLPRTSGWLRGAAQRGHLARTRRRARRARPAAGRRPRHPARQDPRGQGREGPLQHHLRLRRRAGRARGRAARRTPREPPGAGRSRLRLRGGARRVHPARPAHRLRPVDAGDHRRGGLARHPVDPAQQALARAARPGRPRQADPRHHDLGDQLDRGRHRLRQGPHHTSPRRCRPARAQAGLRAYGGPGGHRREADRLPGRGQAARRQPRPRGLPQPPGRGRRARGLPDREGPVASWHGDRRVVRDRQGLPLPDHRRQGRGHRRAGAGARDRRRHQLRSRSWST